MYGYQYGGVTFHRNTAPAASFGVPMQVHTLTLNLLYYPFGELNAAWRPFLFLWWWSDDLQAEQRRFSAPRKIPWQG